MMKHHGQEPCEGEKVGFFYRWQSFVKGSQGRNRRQGQEQSPLRSAAYQLAHFAFLYTPRLLVFGWHHPPWAVSSLISP